MDTSTNISWTLRAVTEPEMAIGVAPLVDRTGTLYSFTDAAAEMLGGPTPFNVSDARQDATTPEEECHPRLTRLRGMRAGAGILGLARSADGTPPPPLPPRYPAWPPLRASRMGPPGRRGDNPTPNVTK